VTGPIVLVHGNPETDAVWDLLLGALDRLDVFRLSPPGFGSPLPSGFDSSMDRYRDWLIARLEAFAQPVHLVGHDWGGLHALNVAMTRPDLLRSWVSDAAGVYDSDYRWHPLAQIWQAPGAGEEWVNAAFAAPLPQRIIAMRELLGADTAAASPTVARVARIAERVAAGQDADMARAVLSLYRSAAQPVMAQAGRGLHSAAARPGLIVDATDDDTTGNMESRARMAEVAGASIARLHGLGHWWMVQDPHRAAQVLNNFWASQK